ncbi:MAG: leucyl/phenylalanyl-tRNA--protein transferase [Draconibacterium sp.]|nr:MAG: leucyl/phenylalanyl-tRNA--protein transferase [Draconibacterium sp.]
MPVYQLDSGTWFPSPELADDEGLLAVGGDLTAERLMLAYAHGIFPWYNEGDPILWWSPNPRTVLFPQDFKASKSLKQSIRKYNYHFRINHAFEKVIDFCSEIPRKGQEGTWLLPEMKVAYIQLNKLGYAWSVETYCEEELVGGLYGVQSGTLFSGESMFYRQTDASKAALYFLCLHAKQLGIELIDVQQETSHLLSLGAKNMTRSEFLRRITNLTSK